MLVTLADARANAGDAAARELLAALGQAVARPASEGARLAAAEAARRTSQAMAARFLGDAPACDPTLRPKVPDFGKGRPLTLGERKSLARKRDRSLIARVLRDPDAAVIRILLGNPALTEDDVVRLSARRPIVPGVLEQVAKHARWSQRYRVIVALVKNPHTPTEVAVRLVPQLRRQDARDVARSQELAASLRLACRERSRKRSESIH